MSLKSLVDSPVSVVLDASMKSSIPAVSPPESTPPTFDWVLEVWQKGAS